MKIKLLVFVFFLCIGNYVKLTAQTENYSSGGAATPNQSTTTHTPTPYDGTVTFTAGSSITSGDWNVLIGPGSGSTITTASHNVFIGAMAGALYDYDATGSYDYGDNVVIGAFAGDQMTGAFDNVFIGKYAARLAAGSDNVAIGTESGLSMTTGYDNTFVGEESGESLTTGYENVFIGEDAGLKMTSGYENTFVGHLAGYGYSFGASSGTPGTGYKNTGIGEESLYGITEGHHNTAVGDSSAVDIGTGIYNTMIGTAAGAATEHADFNTFIGANAGWDNNRTNNENANRNTYVGVATGSSNREGEDNVGMGSFASFGSSGPYIAGNEYARVGDRTNTSRATFLGANADAGNNDVTLVGYSTRVDGQYGIAVGAEVDIANATAAIGIGYQATISGGGDNSILIGRQSSMTDDLSIGIGYQTNVSGNQAIAIGGNTIAQNQGAIVIGEGAQSNDAVSSTYPEDKAVNNIAIGYNALVSGDNAIAIGNGAQATEDDTMILGGATNPVRVGIGTNAPNAYAILDLTSSNKGLFLPRLTTGQRTGLEPRYPEYPSSKGIRETEEGLMVYDTDEKALYFWNGAEWNSAIKDNLGDHTATTILNMADNVIRFDAGEANGIEFNGRDRYKISYGGSANYDYGPVTGVSIKTSMTTSANNGWTWGPYNAAPVAAISTEGKMQIANSLNIAGVYEFPIVDGAANQVLVTDSSGSLTWATQTDNQELSLNTNTLSISGGNDTVDLSGYLDNTDTQSISLATNTLSISGNASTVDLAGYLDNTDNQDLNLSSNTLSLTNDATTVDLSGYLDNTDTQAISLATNTLSITGNAATVDLAGYLDNTDNQDLNLSSNTLSLTNDATVVDLSGYLDNTDAQSISLATNTLSISGNSATVDLSGYLDNTDNQDLSLSSNTLSLTNDVTSVDLSGYLDNTDNQELALAANTLSISGGTDTVNLSGYMDNTDAQTLTLANGNLSITGGNTIDLSGLQDGTGTDSQTLDLSANVLNISNGNAVDLSEYVNTDNQDLTSARLSGTNLIIEIENGTAVTVDLEPVVSSLESELVDAQNEIETLQSKMTDILARLETVESCACEDTGNVNKGNLPILYQNIPNPFNSTSSIKYYLPQGINNASIVFSNAIGQVVSTVALKETGDRELNINSDGLTSGTYFYTLYVGSRKIDTKKMVIE
ncbi:T9SS type A sorting domain-containing protein [Aquimarina sp. AU474]|uniref:T9SS type A sorting domain-containing protein n=1 Tax=Aquimarina sp. AU474 TaxID=2108529 RepID=UPI000D688673|nr:T9SS type A sorting domain-containing protein [Aquimarina sp. AU474]